MFSKLKHVKTDFCCSFGVKRLGNVLRTTMEEGSSSKVFYSVSAKKKWNIDKVRRTTKDKGSHSYKSCNSAKVNVASLSDDDSYKGQENISENGDEEGYLFSSDSE